MKDMGFLQTPINKANPNKEKVLSPHPSAPNRKFPPVEFSPRSL
jgi:hypothetical protein